MAVLQSAPVSLILDSARTHLNDDDGSKWTAPRILPKFQSAFREMMLQLRYADVPLLFSTSAVLTIPALTVDDQNLDISTVTGYPSDLVEPIWIKERTPGQQNSDFVDMTPVDFIPNIVKSTDQLVWWSWQRNTIMVLGALSPVEIEIRYVAQLTTPSKETDVITVLQGELFLEYKTAALVCESIGDNDKALNLSAMAAGHLETLINISIRELQSIPAKRRPYHRGRGRSRAIRDF